ncbi:MAG: carboxypeptidase-like regulatory domain-containing protein [Candidatus Micrarchaeota archaeon]|nr:carboxypeptidase-like regulatory domain-containing protein [Candidatus Micrarchaeota archaeon]
MDFPSGNAIRLYGTYILFIFAVLGVILLSNMDSSGESVSGPMNFSGKNNSPNTGDYLTMTVFIRDIICSNDSGKIVIQSWDYNDYPLPGVSLEISGMGNFATSDDGTQTIEDLDNGTYHVSASKKGYVQKSFDFTISCPAKRIIIMPSANNIT